MKNWCTKFQPLGMKTVEYSKMLYQTYVYVQQMQKLCFTFGFDKEKLIFCQKRTGHPVVLRVQKANTTT